jgi:hypothetical protein
MKYTIQYWVDEEHREQGISELYVDDFTDLDQAIRQAQKIVDSICYACAEVIETETDKVIYGYDGIDFWGEVRKNDY